MWISQSGTEYCNRWLYAKDSIDLFPTIHNMLAPGRNRACAWKLALLAAGHTFVDPPHRTAQQKSLCFVAKSVFGRNTYLLNCYLNA